MLFYRAALPLSRQTLTFVSDLIRGHRREIGTPWRALNPGRQALLVLVHLHKVRVSPHRIGRLAKAIHVLQNYEATAG